MRHFAIILVLCLTSLLFMIVSAGSFSILSIICAVITVLNVFIAGILAANDFDKRQKKIEDMEEEIEILKQENENGN